MPHCVAYKCPSDSKKKGKDISFHILPGVNRPSLRKIWITAIGRPEDNLPKKPHLCSLHFENSCFDESFELKAKLLGQGRERRRLKCDAVPTRFYHKPPPKTRQTTVNRLARKSRQEVGCIIHVFLVIKKSY